MRKNEEIMKVRAQIKTVLTFYLSLDNDMTELDQDVKEVLITNIIFPLFFPVNASKWLSWAKLRGLKNARFQLP